MPFPPQDPLLKLLIRRPDLVPTLLAAQDFRLPRHTVVRAAHKDPAASDCTPRADVVLQLEWAPILGIAVEVSRYISDAQRSAWMEHVASLRRREQCAVELLVVTPDPDVALWAGQPLQQAARTRTPHVLHVPPMDRQPIAGANPPLALLSAVAHADDPDEGRAVHIAQLGQRAILRALCDEEAGWCLAVIRESFPPDRRDKLITPILCPYDREPSSRHFTLGVAGALLEQLVRRHGALPPGVIEYVLTRGLDDLARLRHRLATSQSLDEALAVPAASLAVLLGTAADLIEALTLARQQRSARTRRWRWPWSRSA